MAARSLRKGNTGDDVLKVQKKLKTLGYYSGGLDKSFGSITEAAVKKFQQANSLPATGVVDSKTLAALSGKTKKKTGTTVKKKTSKKVPKVVGAETGRWGGHTFQISPKQFFSFEDLTLKASSELKDKKDSDQGAVARKGASPYDLSFAIHLNAYAGVDVRKEAISFVSQAREGKDDYLYIGGKKLLACRLMLTEVTVNDFDITASGEWAKATVKLTMKQCSGGSPNPDKDSGSGGSGGGSGRSGGGGGGGGSYSGGSSGYGNGGSQKATVRNTAPTTTTRINVPTIKEVAKIVTSRAYLPGTQITAAQVKEGTIAANRLPTLAKQQTAQNKYGSTTTQTIPRTAPGGRMLEGA